MRHLRPLFAPRRCVAGLQHGHHALRTVCFGPVTPSHRGNQECDRVTLADAGGRFPADSILESPLVFNCFERWKRPVVMWCSLQRVLPGVVVPVDALVSSCTLRRLGEKLIQLGHFNSLPETPNPTGDPIRGSTEVLATAEN
jgi:hypothetical protein